jgi:hypothetical protein
MFRFKCGSCDEWHEGMAHLSARAPLHYYSIPDDERQLRVDLNTDFCVIDDEFFFVRGLIEIPVIGLDEPFAWGVWASLSKANFKLYLDHFDDQKRDELGPFFGWLSAALAPYPDTENLKTDVHPRKPDLRPLIKLEPTDHPLAVEQRRGITQERLAQIYEISLHGIDGSFSQRQH